MKQLFFLNLVFLLGISSCTNKKSSEAGGAYPELGREEIMENLARSFEATTQAVGSSTMVYPEYYGGAYTDEQGKFIILIKGDIDKVKKDMEQKTLSSGLNFKNCQYSYNELEELHNRLTEYWLDDNIANELGWTNGWMSVRENRVVVNLSPLNDDAIQKFKSRIMDHPAIIFGIGGKSEVDATQYMTTHF